MQFKNIKKIQPEKQRLHNTERKAMFSNGTKKKLKRAVVALLIAIGIGLAFAAFYVVSAFYDKHAFRFQTPIIMQSPVVMYDRNQVVEVEVAKKVKSLLPTPTIEPTPTTKPKYINFNLVPKVYAERFEKNPSHQGEAQIINSRKHAAVLWRIYMLESTFGKQDDCTEKGLVNGFGFGINTSEHRCYTSFDQVVADVNDWIDDKYNAGWDLGTLLCYYNKGIKNSDCNYAENFLKII